MKAVPSASMPPYLHDSVLTSLKMSEQLNAWAIQQIMKVEYLIWYKDL